MANYTNTDKMYYDLDKHRYILTENAMEEDFNIQLSEVLDSDGSLAPDALPRIYLDRLSRIIYNYIYSWARDKDVTEYVISLPKYREYIQDAMEELCYSFIMNNTDPSVYFTGDTLKSIEVPPAVQTILINNNLLFRGEYYNLPLNWADRRGIDY